MAPCSMHASELPLTDGEHFTYRLSWGIFGKAGELHMTASKAPGAEDSHTTIVMETSTRGVIRALYPFDGRAESLYENDTGRLLQAKATTMSRTKETSAIIDLNYDTAMASYVDHLRPEKSLEVEIPDGNPADFLTTLIQTRTWDLAIGEKRDVTVLFDDEFYELQITAEEEVTIKTPWGKKRALVLIPRMVENPKGMFKRGGEVRVWLSLDGQRLPLRFEVKVKVGTAVAVLTDHGSSDPAAAEIAPSAGIATSDL